MSVENSPESIENYNRVLFNVNNFMVEQTETGDYNQLVNTVVDQLDKLLRPIAITYSEYDEQNRTLRIKEIKANQGMLDIFFKISGKKFSSLATPVDAQLYEEIKAERVKLVPTLHEATGRAVPKTVSSAVSKAIGINCYLGLACVVDGQLYGTSAIALKDAPDHSVMNLLKTYAYYTSMSIKRILAEEALQKSQQEFKVITENMTEQVSVVDLEGRFTFVSKNHYDLCGYTDDELLGKFAWDLIHHEYLNKMADMFREHVSKEEKGRAEFKVVKKDGSLVWVELIVSILKDNGQISGALMVTRDISDRKLAEEALRVNEEKYRFLAENMGDAAWTMDLDLNITYISPSSAKVFGFTQSERLQQKFDQIMPPQSLATIMQSFQEEVLKAQHSKSDQDRHIIVEAEFYHKNGGTVWVENQVKIIRDVSGEITGIYGSSRDITERKTAEEELLGLKKFNERIVQNINEGIIISDKDGLVTFANEALLKMLGYKIDEFIGTHWTFIVPADQHSIVADADKRRNHGLVDRYELTLKHKNGSLIPVQVSGSPYYDHKTGLISGTLAALSDVSELKKAQELIITSEERLRLMTRNIQDVVLETDANGYYTYVSESSESVIGYDNIELLGQRAFDFLHSDDAERVAMTIVASFGNSKVVRMEYRFNHKTRGYIWVEGVGRAYQNNNDETKVLITVRDITDRKQAEEQIHYIGFHDQLTDLYNRHYFKSCEEELKDIPVLSVIMTDLNGLKLINDTYGHGAGDEILKKYADLLRESFKQSDLIFRWGGDEFIVILKNTEEAKSWELCNRLVKHCGETYVKDIPLSISVGISSKLQGGDIDKAIQEAEDMMYKNKLIESKSSKNLIMKTLQQALAEKSFETKEHIDRMTLVGRQFGEQLDLSLSELSRLETLTMLHDIGKINLDSLILLKETALTDKEWVAIKKHPEVGYRFTRTSEEFAYIAKEILAHHERWDEKGYPQGLEGESIPYLSRLLNLIDSYDVMSNGRPYNKKMSAEEIIKEIERCSGTQFDPDLAEEFVACLKKGYIGLA